jgi:hypothetical protein
MLLFRFEGLVSFCNKSGKLPPNSLLQSRTSLSSQEIPFETNDMELFREIRLRDLKFGHLDWKEIRPANAHKRQRGRFSKETDRILHRVSACTLRRFELS